MSDDQMSSDPSKTSSSSDPLPLLTSANYETADKNVVDAALSLMSRSAAYNKEETAMDLVSKDTNQNFVNENLYNGQFSVASPAPSSVLPLALTQSRTAASYNVVDPMVASYGPPHVGGGAAKGSHSVQYVSKMVEEAILLKREPGGL